MRQQRAADGPDKDRGEDGPATEAAQGYAVGQRLHGHQKPERANPVTGHVSNERPDLILAGEQHLF